MNERTSRLRTLADSPVWQDLRAVFEAITTDTLQAALNVATDREAENLLLRARVARQLALAVEQAVQPDVRN